MLVVVASTFFTRDSNFSSKVILELMLATESN